MKALTVLQPWASLIAHGVKRIETRSWGVGLYQKRIDMPLAIHAGMSKKQYNQVKDDPDFQGVLSKIDVLPFGLPFGCVIATCRLVKCVYLEHDSYTAFSIYDPAENVVNRWELSATERAFGYYDTGRYAWLLDNVQMIDDPIAARGALGLWDWRK